MTARLGDVVILADDLSGAAETAASLAPGTPLGVPVILLAHGGGGLGKLPGPVAVDTHTRSLPAEDAARIVTAVAAAVPGGRLLFKKVDSLLRGNWAAELAALARDGRTVVLSPALPRLNRVIRGGRPFVDGVPLAGTPAWRREPAASPASLPDAIPGAVSLPLEAVRDDARLRSAVRASGPGAVLVCDAETDHDLERVADAALESGPPDVVLAGASALGAALARRLGAVNDSEVPAGTVTVNGRALVIVGTTEPRARAQVAALRKAGAEVAVLDPRALVADSTGAVSEALAVPGAPLSVLTLHDERVPDPAGRLSRRLAELTARTCAASPPALLVLTGGETARAVLEALGIGRLTVRGTINGGSALCTTDDGVTVVTRPGSFGDEDDFLRILERISPAGYARLTVPERTRGDAVE